MSGGSYERAFVRMFTDTDGWWAQRAAASGSSTDADLPDVTFAEDGLAFAGELKTRAAGKIAYLDPVEVTALQNYAAAYGMRAVLLARWKGERAYYAYNPNTVPRTDSGKYRLHPDDSYAARIVEPDGAADGRPPGEWTGRDLAAALEEVMRGD